MNPPRLNAVWSTPKTRSWSKAAETPPVGSTLMDFARMVHHDFEDNLKFARVWGSAVHDGTVVKGDYVLHDRDVVELHM